MLIVTAFFGEQFKVFSVPIYCYFIVFTIIVMAFNSEARIRVNKKIQLNNLSHFAVLWAVLATFLFLFTISKVGTQPYLYCIASALIVYVVANSAKDKESTDILFKFAYVAIVFTCIVCVFELITGIHIIRTDEYYTRMGTGNSFGFQVNVNDNASLLVMSLFAPLYFFKRRKVLNIMVLLLLGYLIVRIGSRLAILSALGGLIVAMMTSVTALVDRKGNRFLTISLFFGGLAAIVLLIATLDSQKFLSVISDTGNYANDMARIVFMQRALNRTNLLGYLVGNGAGVTQMKVGYSIHSMFVEILCDYGIFVTAWFASFPIKLLLSFNKSIKTSSKMYLVSFALCYVMISFCSSSMLRIRGIWVLFSLGWSYYQVLLREVKE